MDTRFAFSFFNRSASNLFSDRFSGSKPIPTDSNAINPKNRFDAGLAVNDRSADYLAHEFNPAHCNIRLHFVSIRQFTSALALGRQIDGSKPSRGTSESVAPVSTRNNASRTFSGLPGFLKASVTEVAPMIKLVTTVLGRGVSRPSQQCR
jgi:hypothetical protein